MWIASGECEARHGWSAPRAAARGREGHAGAGRRAAGAPAAVPTLASAPPPAPPPPPRRESLLAGSLGQAVFGGQLFASDAVDTNPLFVAGWAGLIINAINCLPAGELDGGRVFLGLFGRRAASRMSAGA